MQVSLEAIIFNHDPASAVADALNIRRNETEMVIVPEWRKGVSILPDDSPAAYAIDAIGNSSITIKAKFKCLDPKVKSVEVRAIDPARNLELSSVVEGNAIGEVAPREITFDANGETEFESFELINVDIQNRGVSSSIATLIWQCRLRPSDSWSHLRTTLHRIYTIIDVPNCAWLQQPFDGRNPQLPWTEVLDYACEWAKGARDVNEAATSITQAVFDLGTSLVGYDGPSSYADVNFDCASLLSLFRDDKGMGQRFNCEDCATIVSTFANALGCDLWQSRIGSNFTTNPVRLIGSASFAPVDFNYHEVAWEDECSFDNELFDACLQLDGDENPGVPPHAPVLAVQTAFGTAQVGSYRFRLAPLPMHDKPDPCHPTPEKRRRRLIGLNTQAQMECTTELSADTGVQGVEVPQILSGGIKIESWELYRVRFLKRANLIFGAYSLWFKPDDDPEHLMRLDYYQFKTAAAAATEKQRLLDRYQVSGVKNEPVSIISAVDFVNVTRTASLAHAGLVVIEIRSVGRKEIEILQFVQDVSQQLNQQPHNSQILGGSYGK